MEKTDIKKTLKSLYKPTAKDFVIVDVPKIQFVMIDGEGAPEGEEYATAIPWLYSTLYTIKFAAKKALQKDFVVPPLEGLWWADDMDDYINDNKENWKWRMMIATPDWVDGEMYSQAVEKSQIKLGDVPPTLQMAKFEEGKSVQILHLGSYSDEAPTIAKMHHEFMPKNNLQYNGHHHEIYLNDPRRTAPEKLKTILRQPVR